MSKKNKNQFSTSFDLKYEPIKGSLEIPGYKEGKDYTVSGRTVTFKSHANIAKSTKNKKK